MTMPTESGPIDPLEQARHFAAHAARALHVLIVAAPPGRDLEADRDSFAGACHVFFGLFPAAAVDVAREDATRLIRLREKVEVGDADIVVLLAATLEILAGQARTGSGPSGGVGTVSGRDH